MKGRVQPTVAMCANRRCRAVLLFGRGRRPVFCRDCWTRLPAPRRQAVNGAGTPVAMRAAIRAACEVLEGAQPELRAGVSGEGEG